MQNYSNENFLDCWVILSSRIEIVEEVNDYVLSLIIRMILTLKIYYDKYIIIIIYDTNSIDCCKRTKIISHHLI